MSAASAPSAAQSPRVEPSAATIIVDSRTGAGSTVVQLLGAPGEKIVLTVDDFLSGVTARPVGAKVSLSKVGSAEAGKPVLEVALPTDNTPLFVSVDVANLTAAGDSTAALKANGTAVGALTAQRSALPFNVKLDVPSPDKPEITLREPRECCAKEPSSSGDGFLTLKNEDAADYRVFWQLLVDDRLSDGSEVVLPPSGSMTDKFTVPCAWFEHPLAGLLRDEERDARLVLRFRAQPGVDAPYLPTKSIPFQVRLQYWPSWVSSLVLFLTLIAGGVSSLIVSFGLPNKLRKIDLSDQLHAAAQRTSAVSAAVDSRLRVSLRIERARLEQLLHSRWVFSPDCVDTLTQCANGIAALSAALDLVEQIDLLRHRWDELANQGLPPTRADQVDARLQAAADLLQRAQLPADQLARVKTLLGEATSILDKGQDPAFAQELADRVKTLMPLAGDAAYADFQNALPGAFAVLVPDNADATKIGPAQYKDLDLQTLKLQAIRTYVELHDGTGDATLREELAKRAELLRSRLQPNCWDSLQAARLLVLEMECGIYLEDLEEELTTSGAVSIEMDRSVARQNQPLEFSVCFHRAGFNHADARRELKPIWAFGDGLQEYWWSVWHYFAAATAKTLIAVTFVDREGRILKKGSETISVTREIAVAESSGGDRHGRLLSEVLRLTIALFAAVAALFAGAQQQFAKLDPVLGLMAVFGLGFAADTIKNLITRPTNGKPS